MFFWGVIVFIVLGGIDRCLTNFIGCEVRIHVYRLFWTGKRLTSRQETDSPAYLDKRSKIHHVTSYSRLVLHSPKALYRCLPRQHGHVPCFVYTTMVLGQPAWVSKEAYLYANAYWLSLSVGQKVARDHLRARVKIQVEFTYCSKRHVIASFQKRWFGWWGR